MCLFYYPFLSLTLIDLSQKVIEPGPFHSCFHCSTIYSRNFCQPPKVAGTVELQMSWWYTQGLYGQTITTATCWTASATIVASPSCFLNSPACVWEEPLKFPDSSRDRITMISIMVAPRRQGFHWPSIFHWWRVAATLGRNPCLSMIGGAINLSGCRQVFPVSVHLVLLWNGGPSVCRKSAAPKCLVCHNYSEISVGFGDASCFSFKNEAKHKIWGDEKFDPGTSPNAMRWLMIVWIGKLMMGKLGYADPLWEVVSPSVRSHWRIDHHSEIHSEFLWQWRGCD